MLRAPCDGKVKLVFVRVFSTEQPVDRCFESGSALTPID